MLPTFKHLIIASVFLANPSCGMQAQFRLESGREVRVACGDGEKPVVHTALELLARDVRAVLSDSCVVSACDDGCDIAVCTLGEKSPAARADMDFSPLHGKKQAFLLSVTSDGKLVITGSDAHGTAYGIMQLTRLLGVSPWEWWADAAPKKRKCFELPEGYRSLQYPSVEYRGIFINDEDWGLMPWSSKTYEPSQQPGRIGPRTNARIFELMLRLRANTYWPAMHECTVPFFLTAGNREVAARYGIYVGGSHCEPMACSTAGEWPRRGQGEYNFVTNRESVLRFWEERVKEVAGQDIIYTLGMRGVHDGRMNGAKTVAEQKTVLDSVFVCQRQLLSQHVNQDVTCVPQVFIPYKEVQAVYEAGLQVPDDVTLMWCDDNYGYIRHFPTAEERQRQGGNGIYYHISYWGSPHDYLWLGTFSPYLLYQQMKTAYERGIQKLWILNVGDIKPAEYQIELFMDMAWNINAVAEQGVTRHLHAFLDREFGPEASSRLLPLMKEHYRLAYIRKPEFMGNQRVYGLQEGRLVHDLPWSQRQLDERIAAYQPLSDQAEEMLRLIPSSCRDTYFQLVKYPVQAAFEMNKKIIYAQMARHGLTGWERSDEAYDSIRSLTRVYNEGINNKGKWNLMMDYRPRKLPVFEPGSRTADRQPSPADRPVFRLWNGADCNKGNCILWNGLGYGERAAGVAKGETLYFDFKSCDSDTIEVEVHLLPTHPHEGKEQRFELTLDGNNAQTVSYTAQWHKEEWEENVLTNQAVRTLRFSISPKKKHRLAFKALDEGVVLDQIMIYIPSPNTSSTSSTISRGRE